MLKAIHHYFTLVLGMHGFLSRQLSACLIAIALLPSNSAYAKILYGVIAQPPNAVYLISINTKTGTETFISNTGLTMLLFLRRPDQQK
ncbi:MAG: hypothetical protein L3J88_09925 [Gammaproteobacteria bacterium]|nr:hypothetical protein [Gammaproteobacteria bacterium]MCF6363639.1 hypothetical protein [Gammaproteobacteria bacterium]